MNPSLIISNASPGFVLKVPPYFFFHPVMLLVDHLEVFIGAPLKSFLHVFALFFSRIISRFFVGARSAIHNFCQCRRHLKFELYFFWIFFFFK